VRTPSRLPAGGSSPPATELKVYWNFIVYRSRAATEQDFYVGGRRDVLRRGHGGWKIARRKLTLDQLRAVGQERQHLLLIRRFPGRG